MSAQLVPSSVETPPPEPERHEDGRKQYEAAETEPMTTRVVMLFMLTYPELYGAVRSSAASR